MADIQEFCDDNAPCQGLKLAMDAGVIQKMDGEDVMLMIGDGFVQPDERIFYALIKNGGEGPLAIDESLPIECCPFCSDPSFVANV